MIKVVYEASASIAVAENMEQLRSAVDRAVGKIGFGVFCLGVEKLNPSDLMLAPDASTLPWHDLDEYGRSGLAKRDPVQRHLVKSNEALAWRASQWQNTEYQTYFDFLDRRGILSGLAIPLPATNGRVSALMLFSRTPPSPANDVIKTASIIGVIGGARAMAIKDLPDRAKIERIGSLSEFQLEILDLISQGKTNKEIAAITGKSRRAVDYHVREILSKLAVTSRAQAVAIYSSL